MLQVIKAVFTKPLTRVKSCQRPYLICVKCTSSTPLTSASKVPLVTFASRQRPGFFDAGQSCVKNNVKCAPSPLIHLSKIVVQLCYTFNANQRCSKPNFHAMLLCSTVASRCRHCRACLNDVNRKLQES